MEQKSPLQKTVMNTVTQYWNDSCSQEELEYALSHGAVGATTNPVIVTGVLKKEMALWKDRITQIIKELPDATEDDIAWKLIEEMAIKGAKLFMPIFEKEKGKKGRLSIQTNAKYYRSAKRMADQAVHFNTLGPNLQVKMPVTAAGVKAVEESTYQGVSVNATVSFTVPQVIAVAEAVERGLARRKKEGKDCSMMSPVCTMMVGRLDDCLKTAVDKRNICIEPGHLEWAGVACFKKAYEIYKKRNYTCKLLSAAYRNHLQWTEFVGGDVILTIPYKWQLKFNASEINPEPRIDIPVDKKIIEELYKIPEFKQAYDEDGLTHEQFDTYPATKKTLTQFLAGYDELIVMIRNIMIP